jgi:hypothetical protein
MWPFNRERTPVFVGEGPNKRTLWPGPCDCGAQKPEHHKWCDVCREERAQARKAKKREQRQASRAAERELRKDPDYDPLTAGLPDGAAYWWDVKRGRRI